MDRKKEIISQINRISGKYSPYEVFSDWIRCSALAIQNSVDIFRGRLWHMREQEYIETMNRYDEDEKKMFPEMFNMLVETLEEGEDDVLGAIYMEGRMGSKATGQFFTPFHLSVLTAETVLGSTIRNYNGEVIEINEPSSGAGGMIIAAAKVLKDAGIDYQKAMDVVAQDLDWKGVYMTYLQLSLLGIKAKVIQGNTLTEPYDKMKTARERVLVTPAKMGVML